MPLDAKLDVVYPLKDRSDGYELRYSLRSIANLPHRNVWMAGGKPTWAKGVKHIANVQPGTKYKNASSNIRAATKRREVSKDFILMNDDFFILEPLKEIPLYHRGDLEEFITNYPVKGAYWEGMCRTYFLLKQQGIKNPRSYELHTPCIYNKKMKRELEERFHDPKGYHGRTLYYNYYGFEGTYRPDVKIFTPGDPIPETDLLSTSETVAKTPEFQTFIETRFPTPSPYEKGKI